MKTYTDCSYLLFSINQINAQQPLDTIYANDTKNVALFFSEPITTRNNRFHNLCVLPTIEKKNKYFGPTSSQAGKESNLVVVNRNVRYFPYIIRL